MCEISERYKYKLSKYQVLTFRRRNQSISRVLEIVGIPTSTAAKTMMKKKARDLP